MCVNGVNTAQLKDTVSMIDDNIALCRKWTHKMYHLASDGGQDRSAEALKEVQSLLDEVRAAITEAQEAIDEDDTADVKVELV